MYNKSPTAHDAQKSFHAYLMSVVIAQRGLRCGKVIFRVIKDPGVQHPGALSACRHLYLNTLIFSVSKTLQL
jgi:hypothetical protein